MSTWRYSRYSNRLAATPVEKVADPTIPARLDKVLASPDANDWERTFCTSLKAGFDKYKSLTKGQYDTLVKVEERHSPTAAVARDAWKQSWNDEKAANWQLMMEYYSNTSYFAGAVKRWAADKMFIPSEREYLSVCDNVYAKRMIKQVANPPLYSAGHLCVVSRYNMYTLATVLTVGNVTGPEKGSRRYKVVYVGEIEPTEVRERDMRHYRPSMDKKLVTGGMETL